MTRSTGTSGSMRMGRRPCGRRRTHGGEVDHPGTPVKSWSRTRAGHEGALAVRHPSRSRPSSRSASTSPSRTKGAAALRRCSRAGSSTGSRETSPMPRWRARPGGVGDSRQQSALGRRDVQPCHSIFAPKQSTDPTPRNAGYSSCPDSVPQRDFISGKQPENRRAPRASGCTRVHDGRRPGSDQCPLRAAAGILPG